MTRAKANKKLDPATVDSLIAFYDEHLGDVSFPGVDAKHLKDLGLQIKKNEKEIEKLQEKLQESTAALAERHELLNRTALQALEYARIYATDDEGLQEALNVIVPGKTPRSKMKQMPKSEYKKLKSQKTKAPPAKLNGREKANGRAAEVDAPF